MYGFSQKYLAFRSVLIEAVRNLKEPRKSNAALDLVIRFVVVWAKFDEGRKGRLVSLVL